MFILESAVMKGLQFNSVWSIGNGKQIGIEDVLQYVCAEQEQPPRILADYKAVRMQENLTEK